MEQTHNLRQHLQRFGSTDCLINSQYYKRLRSSGHMTNISSLLCNMVFFTFLFTALAIFAVYEYYSFFHVLLTVIILSGSYIATVLITAIFIIREEHVT